MSLKEELDVDIKRFFEQISTQTDQDKLDTLRNLMNKYIHLSKADFAMDNSDLESIASEAKSAFSGKTLPCYVVNTVSGRAIKVSQENQTTLCIVESTIRFLIKKDCLKRKPFFNYKETD